MTLSGDPVVVVCVQPAQSGQTYRVEVAPESAVLSIVLSPLSDVIANPSLGMASPSENAEAVICRQSVQWHAIVKSGVWSIRYRIAPQKQPPSRGREKSVIRVQRTNP